MSDKKFIIAVIFISLIILFGGAFYFARVSKSPSQQPNALAKVQISETSYDWGEIGINEGNVEKTFEINNAGSESLKLSNVQTSCMCTTAQLILDDKQSPLFGMHTKSSYVLEVPPQKSAQVKIVFDPAFHGPSGVGPITRQITLETNDPQNPKLNFMLTALVRR